MLALLLALLGACGGTKDHNDQDVTFARNMIAHHRQAIEMADLADTRSSSSAVKGLATRIKAAQEPEIQQMQGWLSKWGVNASASGDDMGGMSMSSGDHGTGMMSASDMASLGNASGTRFDRAFLTMMIAHHNGAIGMAKGEIDKGKYEPSKKLATSIRDSQQQEVAEMNTLLNGLPAV